MGDWPRFVNLRRCARGFAADAGEATHTTLALTNDSTGAELLLVWQIIIGPSSSQSMACSYQQIGPFGTRYNVAAIVPGDAPPPGALSGGDSVVAYAPDFNLGFAGVFVSWPQPFPFAVLLPGWSLAFQSSTPSTAGLELSIFWEAILPKYFDRMHTHYYLELALAQQGG